MVHNFQGPIVRTYCPVSCPAFGWFMSLLWDTEYSTHVPRAAAGARTDQPPPKHQAPYTQPFWLHHAHADEARCHMSRGDHFRPRKLPPRICGH